MISHIRKERGQTLARREFSRTVFRRARDLSGLDGEPSRITSFPRQNSPQKDSGQAPRIRSGLPTVAPRWRSRPEGARLAPGGAAGQAGQAGQILAEILIVIAIIGTIGGVIGTIFIVSTRSTEVGQRVTQASALALESLEALRAISQSDYDATTTCPAGDPAETDCIDSGWLHIYCPRASGSTAVVTCATTGTKGPAGTGHIYKTVLTSDNCTTTGSGSWDLCNSNAAETITLGGETFNRSVYIENVCRNTSGAIVGVTPCVSSDKEDKGTQKATITITSTNMRTVTLETYLGRWRPANAAAQTDWSGGCTAPVVFSFDTTISSASNIARTGADAGTLKLTTSVNSCP